MKSNSLYQTVVTSLLLSLPSCGALISVLPGAATYSQGRILWDQAALGTDAGVAIGASGTGWNWAVARAKAAGGPMRRDWKFSEVVGGLAQEGILAEADSGWFGLGYSNVNISVTRQGVSDIDGSSQWAAKWMGLAHSQRGYTFDSSGARKFVTVLVTEAIFDPVMISTTLPDYSDNAPGDDAFDQALQQIPIVGAMIDIGYTPTDGNGVATGARLSLVNATISLGLNEQSIWTASVTGERTGGITPSDFEPYEDQATGGAGVRLKEGGILLIEDVQSYSATINQQGVLDTKVMLVGQSIIPEPSVCHAMMVVAFAFFLRRRSCGRRR